MNSLPKSHWLRGLALVAFLTLAYYATYLVKQVWLSPPPTGSVDFRTDEATALAEAKASGKPVLIDFTAEWCGACRELDEQVFSHPDVRERLKAFVPLRLDVTAEGPESLALLQKYGVVSLPAILFVDRNGKVLEKPRVSGLLTPDEFLTVISGL